jgi:membrane protease YdiL (CAAX protease family)
MAPSRPGRSPIPSSPGTGAGPPPVPSLIRKSTLVYGAMTAVGLVVLQLGHRTLAQALTVPQDPYAAARLALIGLLGAGVLLVLSYFFEDWFPSFRDLKSTIMRFLGPCTVIGALYLAAITSVGEELLFRGALQPFAGLVLTSALFGLLHMGKDGVVSAWSVWALLAGLMLGWMYEETGSLWPPIIAHFGVNAVSILSLRRAYRGWASHLQATAAAAPTRPETLPPTTPAPRRLPGGGDSDA